MSDFVKLLDYSSIDNRGEQTFRLITPTLQRSMVKTADLVAFSPKIREIVDGIKAVSGKLYALVNAMGATEFYGPNINGDGFYEDVLRKYHPTFVEKGSPFMYHANKDPNKAYGKVIASDYNETMHRVELIVEYDTTKLDKKYVDKLNNGELVQVSMGCRVPYDCCSICSNRAKSPANYCKHLKNEPGLGRILPDGRRAFAINTQPEFFDISIVTIPADPTARVMLKIASSGQTITPSHERAQETFKIAGIMENDETEKRVPDASNAIRELMSSMERSFGSSIGRDALNSIGEGSSDIFSTLKSFIDNKTFLRPNEVQRIVLVSGGMEDAADKFDDMGILLGNGPESAMQKMMDAIPDRSCESLGNGVEEREMTPENIKRITIRMFLPMDKTASIEDVPISDDYRLLMGEQQMREELPSLLTDPIGAIKAYLMAGSIVAAFNQLLGREVTPALMGSTAIASAAAGPQALAILEDLPSAINSPSQRMSFHSQNDPDVIRQVIMNAILDANIKQGSVKAADVTARTLMALPIAFSASKLLEHQAKKSAEEESKFTGKYDPGFMSKPEYTLPLSLAIALKFAHAKNKINEYVKTAETRLGRSFSDIFKKNSKEVYNSIERFLFK